MKIDPTHVTRPTPAVRRSERGAPARGGEFLRHLEGGSTAGGVSANSPLGTVDALLALQEVDDPVSGRQRAAQRADDILDRLDELRHGLLDGTIPQESLAQLAQLARQRRETVSDPRLHEILDEIELRAKVEIAKYEQERGR